MPMTFTPYRRMEIFLKERANALGTVCISVNCHKTLSLHLYDGLYTFWMFGWACHTRLPFTGSLFRPRKTLTEKSIDRLTQVLSFLVRAYIITSSSSRASTPLIFNSILMKTCTKENCYCVCSQSRTHHEVHIRRLSKVETADDTYILGCLLARHGVQLDSLIYL